MRSDAAAAEILTAGAQSLGVSLPPAALPLLTMYLAELKRWNRRVDLVAPAPDPVLLASHFLDSLTLVPVLRGLPEPPSLLDLGSGAGFPGLVAKIAWPELAVLLVEPRRKRVSFLRHVIRTLDLAGCQVLEGRLQELAPAEPVSWITTRALGSIAEIVRLAAACPQAEKLVLMKGPKGQAEAEAWQAASPDAPFQLLASHAFTLPLTGASRLILVLGRRS
ncbi:MAG: 16S rRNA (guanine(527)-N(7))-methyltransferase RsmG [Thermodesulfobacteriota bacterium]